jgi:hypothetical protein
MTVWVAAATGLNSELRGEVAQLELAEWLTVTVLQVGRPLLLALTKPLSPSPTTAPAQPEADREIREHQSHVQHAANERLPVCQCPESDSQSDGQRPGAASLTPSALLTLIMQ